MFMIPAPFFWEASTPFLQDSLAQASVRISVSFSLSFAANTAWASPRVKQSKETENCDQAASGYTRHSYCYAVFFPGGAGRPTSPGDSGD